MTLQPSVNTLRLGAQVQLRSIGAIMLRELHTRFGRNNIGYLWLILEPMILSGGIAITHLVLNLRLPYGFLPGPFYSSGYIVYIVMRNNVNRATALVQSNKPLLFHKSVTLQDISWARTGLEAIAVFGAMVVILSLYIVAGLGEFPQRPYYLLLSMALMTWLSSGLAMMVSGFSEFSPLVERFVHPLTYLMIPVSGMLYILDELPPNVANIFKWFIFPQITDLARMGLRAEFNSDYVNLPYILFACSVTTLLGLLVLKIARRRMHFD